MGTFHDIAIETIPKATSISEKPWSLTLIIPHSLDLFNHDESDKRKLGPMEWTLCSWPEPFPPVLVDCLRIQCEIYAFFQIASTFIEQDGCNLNSLQL